MTGCTAAWLVVSGLGGLAAAAVMVYPMSRQSVGYAPAVVLTAALTGQDANSVQLRSALLVHHVGGLATGLLYGSVAYVTAAILPAPVVVGGVSLLAHVLATILVVAVIYLLIADVAFPLLSDGGYEDQQTAVRGQWLRSSVVFGASLVVFVPALSSALL